MAIGGFLALLDDVATMAGKVAITAGDDIAAAGKLIATSADDVAVMTKVAGQRASAIITDDVALNANAVTGVDPRREYPIVLRIFRGSLLNKPVLVPLIVGINTLYPPLLGPVLIAGGAYLAYEGAEKVYHALFHKHDPENEAPAMTSEAHENFLVKSAVKTDIVMSAEIIAIGLSTMVEYSWGYQLVALGLLGLGMSVLIYPVIVGGLVKIDDVGLHMMKGRGAGTRKLGQGIVKFMPKLMKGISYVGTTAMFVVGGELISHNTPFLHHAVEEIIHIAGKAGGLAAATIVGCVAGGALVWFVPFVSGLVSRLRQS
ncbi:MAG: rane protein [Micavibrio sp.]|nr:rane protein [Micavibrio sp.]